MASSIAARQYRAEERHAEDKARAATLGRFALDGLFILILFENVLQPYVSVLGYYDEAAVVILLVLMFVRVPLMHVKLSSPPMKVLTLTLFMIILGTLGSLFFRYQSSLIGSLKDVLAFVKFPLGFVALDLLLPKGRRSDTLQNAFSDCVFISKAFVVLCGVAAVLNLASPSFGFGHDVRNGIRSLKFVFTHPTFLVYSLVVALTVLVARNRRIDFFKVIALVTILLTMRDKGFAIVAAYVVFWIVKIGSKRNVLPYILLGLALVAVVVAPKIETYLAWSNSPREAMYATSFLIANGNFPLGSGWATFASSLSGEYYSPLYFIYGLSTMEGMSPTGYFNMGDAGWTYYIAQFGWLGVALFALSLWIIVKAVLIRLRGNEDARQAAWLIFTYLILSCTVEAVFTNPSGIMSLLIVFLFLGTGNEEDEVPKTSTVQLGGGR